MNTCGFRDYSILLCQSNSEVECLSEEQEVGVAGSPFGTRERERELKNIGLGYKII